MYSGWKGWSRAWMIAFALCALGACGSEGTEAPRLVDGDHENAPEEETEWEMFPEEEAEETPFEPFDYCEPETPPDAECWITKRQVDSPRIALAREIADKILAEKDPTSLRWDWGEAVMMLGLTELYRITGDASYRDFTRAWADHHIEKGFMLASSDTCAPVAVVIELYREDPSETYRNVIQMALDYLDHEALRTPEGGLNHLGTWDALGVALWIDSLFMFGNVMTKWGDLENDSSLLDFYVAQFDIFATLLQKESGFFKHATEAAKFTQEEGIFWGRGNGWIVAAAFDHLRVRSNRRTPADSLLASARRLVQAATETQDAESGLWWTVLNRPGETYLETSAGALFAFGMSRGYRYGYLDDSVLPVIDKAMQGVMSRITRDESNRPVVTGVSGPTNPGTTDYYGNVAQIDDISYGVGAILLALIETSGLPLPSEGGR